MKIKIGCFCYGWSLLFCFALSGCSYSPIKELAAYTENNRSDIYRLQQWEMDGRVSLRARNDSWSAGIEWMRRQDNETIRIVGPLGQGVVYIVITDDYVDVDRGEGAVRYFDQSDDFITEQLGFYVPLRSLRYWVVGLTDPDASVEKISDGFIQDDWRVLYRQMQKTERGVLPHKIDVSNSEIKLKLIIHQWVIHD